MINYNKYILSAGTHYISNSGHDENGKYHGGKAGDQSDEWTLRSWYNRPWSCVLRWNDQAAAELAAELAIEAAQNNKIGYDQYQRKTFWTALEAANYRPANITTACESDCTAGVTAIWKAVGNLLGITKLKSLDIGIYSGNMRAKFKAAGFTVLTDSKYRTGRDYLLPGDVLLYEGHHAATNITIGKNAGAWNQGSAEQESETAFDILRKGSEGEAVRTLQDRLILLGYKLPKYGIDGDFGEETEMALKQFQTEHKLEADGEYGPKSDAAMKAELSYLDPKRIKVTGGSVNIRSAPNTNGKILGVVRLNQELPYQGITQNGWHLIIYDGENAWISGKYSVVE